MGKIAIVVLRLNDPSLEHASNDVLKHRMEEALIACDFSDWVSRRWIVEKITILDTDSKQVTELLESEI